MNNHLLDNDTLLNVRKKIMRPVKAPGRIISQSKLFRRIEQFFKNEVAPTLRAEIIRNFCDAVDHKGG